MKALWIIFSAGLLLAQPAADARDFRPGTAPRLQPQDQAGKRAGGYGGGAQKADRFQRVEPEKRKPGRLTEEERRDLRRDVDRANREIYRRRDR